MAISFECSNCGKRLKANDRLAGRNIRCPACQTVVNVVASVEQNAEETIDSAAERVGQAESQPDDFLSGFSSEQLEDPEARRERNAARRREQAEADDSAPATPIARPGKKKLGTSSDRRSRTDSDSNEPFRFHWVFLLALTPLTFSVLSPDNSTVDRFQRSLEAHPEIRLQLESATSLTELLMALPDHRIEGALFGRDTWMHWLLGAMSAGAFLCLLFVMFPGSQNRTKRLLLVGLFTGTVGILVLLAFQFMATISQGFRLRGRGLVILIALVVQLIGFSYRCASDPTIGFWGSFFGFTLGVGLCEEICKALPIWFYLRSGRKTGWRGACLTGLASGIGFGVSEGIMYSGDMYNGIHGSWIYLVRFVSCVSLHAMWSGSVALMMYRNQDFMDSDDWGNILAGLAYYLGFAMIMHGLYDTLLKHDMHSVALMIGVGSYLWMFHLVRTSRGR